MSAGSVHGSEEMHILVHVEYRHWPVRKLHFRAAEIAQW